MLSYRHAFHAGNHADVFKHWVLSLILEALCRKEKPFFVLDTHAGAGRYALDSEMALKNGEFREGIGKLWSVADRFPALAPYFAALRTTNPGRELRWYPGSPRIIRHFLRGKDRLHLTELHPSDRLHLSREFEGDRQVRVEERDGYDALKALLPPLERRGLVHIDPAFERKDERGRLVQALGEAYRRWATGIYAIWYPIQDRSGADDLLRRVKRLGIPRTLVIECAVTSPSPDRLTGSGMILINPPYLLEETLREALPDLVDRLEVPGTGSYTVEWLVPETPSA
jgi:23S rRNA (adenine2030-N6)-methyltransferase